jgi:hypothetical protein
MGQGASTPSPEPVSPWGPTTAIDSSKSILSLIVIIRSFPGKKKEEGWN